VSGFGVARGPNTRPSPRDASSGELSGNGDDNGFGGLEANGPKTIDFSSLICGNFEAEVERVGPKIRDESLMPALLSGCVDERSGLIVVGRNKFDGDEIAVVGVGVVEESLLLITCGCGDIEDFEAKGPKIVPVRGDCCGGCCVLFEASGPNINPSLDGMEVLGMTFEVIGPRIGPESDLKRLPD